MSLRKSKAKYILESSIDCVLLAVEIYNKPRTKFKVQCFVSQMIIGWTRLFHAYFHRKNENSYYFKEKNGRFKIIDGEKKAWDLKKCINEYGQLSEAVKKNLEFFIGLRNRIEHRNMNDSEIELKIFGECQSLLFNYENLIVKLFGKEFSINECLSFSLQFSTIRKEEQKKANKQLLTTEVRDIVNYIEKYRNEIKQDTYDSEEFSIKLLLVPKISNTSRNELSIEYVKLDKSIDGDSDIYNNLTVLVKEKIVKVESSNLGKIKPSQVLKKVNSKIFIKINQNDHKEILSIFKIRQYKSFVSEFNPEITNSKYCVYDEPHKDYLYTERWVDFIVNSINNGKLTKEIWKNAFKEKKVLNIEDFL